MSCFSLYKKSTEITLYAKLLSLKKKKKEIRKEKAGITGLLDAKRWV